VICRLGAAIGDVFAHGSGKKAHALCYDTDLAPQRTHIDLAIGDAFGADLSRPGTTEAENEIENSGLACAVCPDDGQAGSALQIKIDVPQHRMVAVVERDVPQVDVTFERNRPPAR